MPHLENVSRKSRAHHRAEMESIDFHGGLLVSKDYHRLESDSFESDSFESEKDFIHSLIGNIPSEVDQRLLVADDLSDDLIHILGSCLHITPEFFEEHLLNSAWHNNTYKDR